jgi:hypothetical protein
MLAKKTDTNSMWMQRIEEGKRKIDQRFREALADHAEDLPFGSIQLHLWATAIRRPQLADRPARATEPYGVAELFRQVMESAEDFYEQRDRARFVLGNTIIGLAALVLLMAASAAAFFWNRPTPEFSKFEGQINSILPNPKAPKSELFREPLEERLKRLQAVEADPLYNELPSPLRGEIVRAQKEMKDYLAVLPAGRDLTREALPDNEEELREYEAKLKSFLHSLGEYAEAWQGTELVGEVKQRQIDVQVLRKGVEEELDWLDKQRHLLANLREEGFKLRASSDPIDVVLKKGKGWVKQSDEALKRERRFQNRDKIDKNSAVFFEDVTTFQPVIEAHDRYVEAKKNLENIRSEVFEKFPHLRSP